MENLPLFTGFYTSQVVDAKFLPSTVPIPSMGMVYLPTFGLDLW